MAGSMCHPDPALNPCLLQRFCWWRVWREGRTHAAPGFSTLSPSLTPLRNLFESLALTDHVTVPGAVCAGISSATRSSWQSGWAHRWQPSSCCLSRTRPRTRSQSARPTSAPRSAASAAGTTPTAGATVTATQTGTRVSLRCRAGAEAGACAAWRAAASVMQMQCNRNVVKGPAKKRLSGQARDQLTS